MVEAGAIQGLATEEARNPGKEFGLCAMKGETL
jgi:hypothetical protein